MTTLPGRRFQMGIAPGTTAAFVAAALVLGAAGAYFWRGRDLAAVKQARETAQAEVAQLTTKLDGLGAQVKALREENGKLAAQIEQISGPYADLQAAVQVTTSARDAALAFGRAAMTRNQTWVQALLVDGVTFSFAQRPELKHQTALRYAILRETAGKADWTYVVRVWEAFQGREIGYWDATLTIARVQDVYKVTGLRTEERYTPATGK